MIKNTINFNIVNVDGLGQGVYRGKPVTFIEKTLPGEEGTAAVYREAKGVRFAALETLTKKSPLRIAPQCPHFETCTGCQYLHTDYSSEIDLKKKYLERLLQPIFKGEITAFPASERFHYRNRIQLHYDLESGEMGFISKLAEGLINAEGCLLPVKPVVEKIKKLYSSGSWKENISDRSPLRGTIEVYQKGRNKPPAVAVNKPYASGGFMQVNTEMNNVLTGLAEKTYDKYTCREGETLVLDIFGGNGNLTRSFRNARVLIADIGKSRIDKTGGNISTDTYSQDLYRKGSINNLLAYTKRRYKVSTDLLVFDPPRKGVKFFRDWADAFNPKNIFYASCNPETFKRDALNISGKYEIKEISLVDLFPGTRHFETFAVFERR